MMKGSTITRLGLIALMAGGLAVAPLLGCSDDEQSGTFVDVGEEDAGPSGGDDTGPSGGDDTDPSGDDAGPSGDDAGGDDAGDASNNDTPPGPGDSDYEVLFDETVPFEVSGYTEYIEVEAPEGINSMAITILDGPPDDMYYVTGWTGPDGFEIVPDGWESGGTPICHEGCNNRIVMDPGAFGGLAPNNPSSEVTAGTHTFRVGSQSGGMGLISETLNTGSVRVVVHGKVDDAGAPSSGTLDLNFFFTGAGDWTADSAPNDPAFQGMVDLMDEIYDQVNIDIGNISYHDADPQYRTVSDVQSGSGELGQLFAKSERADLEGPSVFFVEGIDSGMGWIQEGDQYNEQMGGGILGIAGGIPGPMIVDGTPRSGVAVDVDASSGTGAPGIAHVTAHEVGHYLGLFHTTENFGGFMGMPEHDPLPDTPPHDESYLMHASGSGDLMSEWQGRVMRKNPWVY